MGSLVKSSCSLACLMDPRNPPACPKDRPRLQTLAGCTFRTHQTGRCPFLWSASSCTVCFCRYYSTAGCRIRLCGIFSGGLRRGMSGVKIPTTGAKWMCKGTDSSKYPRAHMKGHAPISARQDPHQLWCSKCSTAFASASAHDRITWYGRHVHQVAHARLGRKLEAA